MRNFIQFPLLLAGMFLAGFSVSSEAQYTGIFGYGIELSASASGAFNPDQTTLYALNNGGGSALLPPGSSATLDENDWGSGSSGSNPTFNLGTFNPSAGDTLTLPGGAILTFQGNGGAIFTGAVYLNYEVFLSGSSGSFPPGTNLPENAESNPGGTPGNELYDTESQSINLLSGLAPGTYELETYGYAGSSTGDKYANGNGSNYGALFTVVPEPNTWAMLLSGIGVFVLFRCRRAVSRS